MPFGQMVIGPPGSGKSTYCNGMHHYFELIGRPCVVVNLDPANDGAPYECAVNIMDLISLEDVQRELGLGPNGGLVYALDYLQENMDWLQEQLKPYRDTHYVLFDCPGQVELFTLHSSFKQIVGTITGAWDYRLCAVHLVDAHLCTDPSKYVSALLLSLSAMLHLEVPQVNVLSKIDLIEQYGELAFNLDFYTEVQDLNFLVPHLDAATGSRNPKFKRMNKVLCEVIEDFSLVNFTTLHIEDKDSVTALVKEVDKANGFVWAGLKATSAPSPEFEFASAATAGGAEVLTAVTEKHVPSQAPPGV